MKIFFIFVVLSELSQSFSQISCPRPWQSIGQNCGSLAEVNMQAVCPEDWPPSAGLRTNI